MATPTPKSLSSSLSQNPQTHFSLSLLQHLRVGFWTSIFGANIMVIGFASGDVPVIPANIALVKVPGGGRVWAKYENVGLWE